MEQPVVEAMITNPKTMASDVTVSAVRAAFANEHVHMVLLADAGILRGTLLRQDLEGAHDDDPARPLAVLSGRTIHPSASAEHRPAGRSSRVTRAGWRWWTRTASWSDCSASSAGVPASAVTTTSGRESSRRGAGSRGSPPRIFRDLAFRG